MPSLLKRIEDRRAVVGVIGMGYVGLPLAQTFCASGFRLVGFDIDAAKIKALMAGRSYIKHIPSRVVREMRKGDRFTATADFRRLRKVDAIIICVPTPLTKEREPDLSYVTGTGEAIAPHLRRGHLVVLESTTYPGTTRDELIPILETSGLVAGKDFHVAFSPEREDPGNKHFTTRQIPKVVGGYDRESLRLATALYGAAVDRVVKVGSLEVAEACKVTENIYRAVNIALVNELKIIYDRMGIDVWEVLEAAGTKPFGFGRKDNKTFFTPGPGLGGHCIPIDPFYLTWKAREYGVATRFIELAGEINTSMPEYVVQRLMIALNERGKAVRGAKVCVLGIAYKPDIDDMRESPSVVLIEKLRALGARVTYNDPYIPKAPRQREHNVGMTSRRLTPAFLAAQDAVLIATNHSDYDYDQIVRHSRLVIDTRNACRNVRAGRRKVIKA
ncbi:MAG: nucleotide sugar dehydrogenase [Acidobacteria bacterium]|nr:nucleotide sugar dehydrogenase [Planctomycetota bacterium]MBE3134988.1 nucleotide sugar dehydrogenase [Acidobacteriota bacterium]